MNITVIAATISSILAIYSAFPYIRSVLNGKTKPHRLGWLIFSIMNGMVFFAQIFSGGRLSTLVSLIFFIFSLSVFGLSFSKGTNQTSASDWVLFSFAVLAMILWAVTRNNALAIWLTLFIDLIATAMIILKVRRHPSSENASSWIIQTIAYVFTCLTLYNVRIGILYVRPLYGLICDVALVASILYFNSNPKKSKRSTRKRTPVNN